MQNSTLLVSKPQIWKVLMKNDRQLVPELLWAIDQPLPPIFSRARAGNFDSGVSEEMIVEGIAPAQVPVSWHPHWD